jgi:hypothetical protein
MAWVRLEDSFDTHPKITRVSLNARWAYIVGLCRAARHLTDGHLAEHVAAEIAPAKVRRELVAAGLWIETPEGVEIHDFSVYNPTRAQVEQRRAAGAERLRRWREERRDDDGNAVTNAVTPKARNAVTNGVTDTDVTPLVTPTPSRPVPTRPKEITRAGAVDVATASEDEQHREGHEEVRAQVGASLAKANSFETVLNE